MLRVSQVSLTDRQTNPPRKVGSDTIVSNAVPNSQEVQADRIDARAALRCAVTGCVRNASMPC